MIINLSNRDVRLILEAIKDQKNWYKKHRDMLNKPDNTVNLNGASSADEIIAEYESLELKLKP